MGRHRHAVTVRADGLGAVLGSLLHDPRVLGAVLVDVDSGMVLDACPGTDGAQPPAGAGIGGLDPELVGAGHAELSRVALALPGSHGRGTTGEGREWTGEELVLSLGPTRHHLLRAVPDPHGDRLVLAVVVDGTRRFADRVRRKLRGVPADALTAGPTVVRRPGTGGWAIPAAARPVPGHPPSPGGRFGAGARGPAVLAATGPRLVRGPSPGVAPARANPVPGGLFDPSPRPGPGRGARPRPPEEHWAHDQRPPAPPAALPPGRSG